MGSKSPKAKIDRFNMTGHYGICQGPVDEVKAIRVKEKVAWEGSVKENSTISISKENLFGGITKEGGVSGLVEIMFGGPSQKVSNWFAQRLGRGGPDNSPGYRGILSLLFRGEGNKGFYWTASTPYLGELWVTVARYPRQLDPATALVPREAEQVSYDQMWKYRVEAPFSPVESAIGMPAQYTWPWYNDTDWLVGRGGFGNIDPGSGIRVGTYVGPQRGKAIWLRRNVQVTDPLSINHIDLGLHHDDGCWVWWNGVPQTLESSEYYSSSVRIPASAIQRGQNSLVVQVIDSVPAGSPSGIFAGVTIDVFGMSDANPAHIIYESLTNADWGMGTPVADIDVDNFAAVARTLYDERHGVTLMWAQASSVQDFIGELLDCIKGALYTNPRSGQITLKLMRDDYDPETLRPINPDNARLRNFSRKAWGETTNEMKITWTNPRSENEESLYAQDLGNIAMQGAVISDSKNYYMVRQPGLAQRLANRELRQASAPLRACEATVDRSMWDVTPFECLKLDWPEYGVNGVIMRVMDVNYGKTGDSAIKLSLVEDIFSLTDVTFIEPPIPEWEDPSDIPAEPITRGRILPVPPYMAAQNGETIAGMDYPETLVTLLVADPGGFGSSGYTIEVQEPTPSGGLDWVAVYEPRDFFGTATLGNPIAAEVYSTLAAFTDARGQDAAVDSFLVVGPDSAPADELEIMLVTDVDLISGEMTVLRGALDTVPKSWPAGAPVWVGTVDDFLPVPLPASAGQTISVRVTGQSSSNEGAPSVVFTGTAEARPSAPLRPANTSLNGVSFGNVAVPEDGLLEFTWSHRNRLMEDTQVLDWAAASVPAEAGVSYRVVSDAFGPDGSTIAEAWFTEDAGTGETHIVDLTGVPTPEGAAGITMGVEAVRGDDVSWQRLNYTLPLLLLTPPTNLKVAEVDEEPDPYWDSVVSLIRFDGGLSATKGSSLTLVAGTPTYAERDGFGGQYVDLTSKNVRATISDPLLNFGTEDFTFEVWVRKIGNSDASSGTGIMYDARGGGNNSIYLDMTPDNVGLGVNNCVRFYFEGTDRVRSGQNTLTVDGLFHHVALVRVSGLFVMFIDGIRQPQTYLSSAGCTADNATVFARYATSGGAWFNANAFIDDLRITRGVARYTEDFTPPTEPFPNFGP